MKKIIIILVIILGIFGGIFFLNKNDSKSSTSQVQSNSVTDKKISFSDVESDIANKAKLYDVRTNEEYMTGHINGSENWSLQDMQAGKLPDVNKDTKIYVYCHSGNRSAQATTILKSSGFNNVVDLHGIDNVQSIGGKIIK